MLSLNLHRIFILALCTGVAVTSCGRREQKIQTLSTTSLKPSGDSDKTTAALQALTDPSCSSVKKCPAVAFKLLDETGKEAKARTVKQNTEVEWSFSLDSKAIAGRLLVMTKQYPAWSQVEKGESIGSKKIFGKATQLVKNGELIFIVRDMMLCKVSEKDLETCLDVDAELSYDKPIEVGYSVEK